MGIVNVTPDSFSDGGVHFDRADAIDGALRMAEEGAAVVDVGGESTRPGSDVVSVDEELSRVIPVIEGIRQRSEVFISIDTTKSAVASAALEAGADLVNDISAMRFDSGMATLVAEAGCPLIMMHMRGRPKTMQENVHYDDLIGEIRHQLSTWATTAVLQGVKRDQILIDPGIGFGKTFDHNLEILRRLNEFVEIAPVVVGASRKAFIGQLTGRPGGKARAAGSLGTVAAAALGGAAMVRVHDVAETVDFLKVFRQSVELPRA
jgi:dihydropteroate synthase